MILRYLRLYRQFILFSISRTAEFRLDFFFQIIMDCIYYGTNIFFFKVLFLHSSALAGWTEAQTMVFVGIFLVVDGINMTLFSKNVWFLPFLVNKGELDYYLLRPVSSMFFLSTREVAVSAFVNLLAAVGILIWAIYQYPQSISWDRYMMMTILIISGSLLFHFLRLLFTLPVFGIHSGRGGEIIYWTAAKLLERPDRIFRSWMRIMVISVLPFAIMSSYPAHVLWEANPWRYVGIAIGVTSLFAFISIKLWNLALRSYSSASS